MAGEKEKLNERCDVLTLNIRFLRNDISAVETKSIHSIETYFKLN